MHRRHFLGAATTATLSALGFARTASAQPTGAPGMAMGRRMGPVPAPVSTWPTGLPLPSIELLLNTSGFDSAFAGSLVAAPYAASLVSGHATELWGYNRSFPGPAIEVWEGQRVSINFTNHLGVDSTIHWHGLPVPPDQDGSPMDPVTPGATRTYTFDLPVGSAGTYWYHPHAHGTTALQVGHGLAAPFIVRREDDPLGTLPEVTLMIMSLTLDQNGQVIAPASSMGGMGGMMAADAGELLVNGQKLPVHTMQPGATERWRVLNATADRYLRITLDGHRFTVVGTDGGLLGSPLPGATEWLLAPAQRVEIVVTISARQSARFSLRDLGYGNGMSAGIGAELMTIETGHAAAQSPVTLSATLRPVADLGPATVRQRVVLSGSGMGMMGSFLINGRTFDMNRVDLETTVGRVELWDLVNTTFMDHPIHIHGTQFQVVAHSVQGQAAPVAYPAWVDTVNVPAGETVTIKTRQMLPGKRMLHCHILQHEDAGMMAVLDVRSS